MSGFGSIFTDVDLANLTTIEFFNTIGVSLGVFSAPTANNGLSFLGVFFDAGERIGRVRITNGNVALGPNDVPANADVVVMDDFIYSEPAAVPEPATLLLLIVLLRPLAKDVRIKRSNYREPTKVKNRLRKVHTIAELIFPELCERRPRKCKREMRDGLSCWCFLLELLPFFSNSSFPARKLQCV